MAAPFYPKRQQVAVKIETTEGTDAVPADADVISPIYDAEYTPTVEMFAREAVDASFSRFTQVAGEQSAAITFSTELKGSGTAGTPPPNLDAPLRASGFAVTNVPSTSDTYDPASVSLSSATVELKEGSANTVFKRRKLIGARANVTFTATKGQPVLVTFEFIGRYVEPDDSTQFVSAAFTPQPEPFLGAAFTFHTISLKISELTLNMNNEVVLRNDANEATGNFSAVITGRAPTGTIDPEREDTSVINTFNRWTSDTEGVVTFVLGSGAGNITTFTASKAQITAISEADRDGIRVESLDLAFNKSLAAGDDEVSIVFT